MLDGLKITIMAGGSKMFVYLLDGCYRYNIGYIYKNKFFPNDNYFQKVQK
jgi:hypothetical protein